MNTPDNQDIMEATAVRDVLHGVLAPMTAAPAAPQPRTEAAPVEPAKPESKAAAPEPNKPEAKPADVAPAADAKEVAAAVEDITPDTPDPYESVINAALPTDGAPATITPEIAAAFKSHFGTEDPAEVQSRLTAAELLKTEYDQAVPTLTALNSMPPALQNAFALAMEGKIDEAQSFLQNLPGTVLSNKDAASIPKEKLIDAYFPGKLSEEDREALKDPDTDPDIKDAIKARMDHWHKAAKEMHESALTEQRTQQQKQAEGQKAAFENYKKATADSLTAAKQSPLGALVDPAVTNAITTGAYMKAFVQEDGVTPTKDAATRYLWAIHGEKLMKVADARGFKRGQMEGKLDATSRQPSVPASQRSAGDTPTNLTPAQQEQAEVNKLLAGVFINQ